ncbi:MAG: glycosyltransferase family 39 protein [Thermomicrobiales bacterium]|nr:glycosyltransferase family 39 protein [Thermomicrobiales bacterium]
MEVPRWNFAFPFIVWLAHFLIVQITATLASIYGTDNSPTSQPYSSQMPVPPAPGGIWEHLVVPMRTWDGLWYRLISVEGYPREHVWNDAFWPLFPMSMRGLSRITRLPEDVSGYLIANISFFVALVLLYQLVRIEFDTPIARRTLWALALFPTSLFFTAVYTESTFLMLSVAAILCARLRKWWLAGVLGALAALTRSHGIFLVIPFAVLWVKQYGFYVRAMIPKGITVGMPLLGPIIFGAYLERTQDNWRNFIEVQGAWNRTFSWPWRTFDCAINGCVMTVHQYGEDRTFQAQAVDWGWIRQLIDNPSWSLVTSRAWRARAANGDVLELVSTILFIALIVVGFKVLPLYQSLYLVPGILIPLFQPSSVHPLMSIPRFGLVLFPLFIVMAILLRKRWLYLPVAAISTILLILLTLQFSTWYWVS